MATLDDLIAEAKKSPPSQSSSLDDLIAQAKGGGAAPPDDPNSLGNTAADVAMSLPSGVAKGAVETAMSPLTFKRLGDEGGNWVMGKLDAAGRYLLGMDPPSPELQAKRDAVNLPLNDWVDTGQQKVRDALAGVTHAPTTRAGRYAETIGEFLPAAFGGEGGTALNLLRRGVLPAVASQGGGEAAQALGLPEGAGKLLGAILGGGAGTLIERPSVLSERMAGTATRDVTGAQWQQASDLMQRAQQAGVPLTTAEAIQQVTGGSTRMGDLQRLVESQGVGQERLTPFMAARPGQVQAAGENVMGQIAPDALPAQQGLAAQGAAEGALDARRRLINASADPYYQAAQRDIADPSVAVVPQYAETLERIRNDPVLSRTIAGMPDNSAVVADAVKQQMEIAARNEAAVINPTANHTRSSIMSQDANMVRELSGQNSPDLQLARAIGQQGREQSLAPLEAGPVGKIAGSSEPSTQVKAVFPDTPMPGSGAETDIAMQHLIAQNPDAARGLTRQALESKFNTAMAPRGAAPPDEYGGARFANAVRGTPERAAVTDALLQGTATAQTQRAFNDLVDALSATRYRQRIGSRTAFNAEALKEMEGGGLVGASKLAANPFASVREVLSRARLGKQTNRLADLMLNPDAIDRLQQLAARSGQSPGRDAVIRALLQSSTSDR